jgi:glycoside hydrolase-like protein
MAGTPRAKRGRQVVDVPHGAIGFDTDTRWTGAQYAEARSLGFRFAFRYLGDLSSEEVDEALGADMMISAIQHAHPPGWECSVQLGADDGARAVRDARSALLPPGLPLWADLEEVATGTGPSLVAGYSQAWCAHVVGAGFPAGVYWGAGMPGDSQQLYQLPFTSYFKSFSNVVTPWRRGYQLYQLFHFPRGECIVADVYPDASSLTRNLAIDVIAACSDYVGSRARMLKAA